MREACDRFLAERVGNDLRPNTGDLYSCLFRKYLNPICGDVPLASVKRESLQAVISLMLERGLMPYTVVTNHGFLKGFFSWIVDKAGYLEESPVKGLTLPEVYSKAHGRVITAEQCSELLDLLYGDPLWIVVFLGMYSGLRPGEVVGLPWEAVGFDTDAEGAQLSVESDAAW